ncbi:hypothetical protein MUN81_18960 [Hymenobacter sp. 5317J-9]|uniref:hypothetical protein n=1 Tax=Hymenobacter sp. 5317J-9 TaxID=2932250 RepID=UPI001FD72376|nr:hypothetical protein [Hymenobacter sp. 5317J-9]UOQ97307.1 hypothetical protein MUN81_18960 [Hymenobacter sp. 5317J-9]
MTKTFFALLLAGAFASPAVPAQTNAWGQKKNTYQFGKPAADVPAKLPKALPGRIHLRDGRTVDGPIAYLDYNKIVSVSPGAKTAYTPLEVGSFVMEQDSFVVLKDFKVTVGADEQEYRIAFVRVGAVGAGLALYQFRGTMKREDAVHYGAVATPNGFAGNTYRSDATEYEMTKAWILKRDDSPQWLSLTKSGSNLRAIVEPLIADDARLSKEVKWGSLTTDKLPAVLNEYIADKKARSN